MSRRRSAVLSAVALAALVLAVVAAARWVPAGQGGRDGLAARLAAPPIERIPVGRGARGAVILREQGADPDAPVVAFLHGWTAIDPAAYGAWLRHLVRRGATVVYPTYQVPPFVDVTTPAPAARAGLRAALARLGPRRGPLVAAGHSAGGALAADLAATARGAGLPVPAAVYAVYPGRALRGFPFRLAVASPSRIPRATTVLALASPHDRVVGTATARALVAGAVRVPAERRTLRLITRPSIGDHRAPQRAGPRERRAFWAPLDRLLSAAVRAQASGSRPSQVPADP